MGQASCIARAVSDEMQVIWCPFSSGTGLCGALFIAYWGPERPEKSEGDRCGEHGERAGGEDGAWADDCGHGTREC